MTKKVVKPHEEPDPKILASDIQSATRSLSQIASQLALGDSGGARRRRGVGDTDLKQIVDSALTDVLGRRVTRTPTDFLEALTRVYEPVETATGSTRYERRAQPYLVQSGGGTDLFGTQASLYERGRQTLEAVQRLLTGLRPLTSSPDQEEVEALRALVRGRMIELVDELGLPGGPRMRRVDRLFFLLAGNLGENEFNPCKNPKQAVTLLDQLQAQFGLCPEHVITVDEEKIFTDFQMLRDHVFDLYAMWNKHRASMRDADEASLGTQLVRLGRIFSVIDESVQQVVAAMDASFLGPMERQVVTFNLNPSRTAEPENILVSDALDWAERIAREGPVLLQESGKRAARVINDDAVQLVAVLGRMKAVGGDATPPHPALGTDGVQTSLEELVEYFEQLRDLIEPLVLPGKSDAAAS